MDPCEVLNLEQVGFPVTHFVGDDAAGVGIQEVVVVVDDGVADSAVDGEHIVVWREFGAFEADLFAVGKAPFAFNSDRRVEDGFTHSVEVFEVFVEVPGLVVEPVDIHVHRAGFEELPFGAEALAQPFPAAHETLIGPLRSGAVAFLFAHGAIVECPARQ